MAASVTLLCFLGVSICDSLDCTHDGPHECSPAPRILLSRPPFMINLAPHPNARLQQKMEGGEENLTLLLHAGAGMDTSGGGFHPRVALRAAAKLFTPSSIGPSPIIATAAIGGSCSVIQLRYPPPWRRKVLRSIRQLTTEGPDLIDIKEALAAETADAESSCRCLSDCCCSAIDRSIYQAIEAFDPLPHGATRSGNRLRLHRVSEITVKEWSREFFTGGWIHINIDQPHVHQSYRAIIIADIIHGLGEIRFNERPPLRPSLRSILRAPTSLQGEAPGHSHHHQKNLIEISVRPAPLFDRSSKARSASYLEEKIEVTILPIPRTATLRQAQLLLHSLRLKNHWIRRKLMAPQPPHYLSELPTSAFHWYSRFRAWESRVSEPIDKTPLRFKYPR